MAIPMCIDDADIKVMTKGTVHKKILKMRVHCWKCGKYMKKGKTYPITTSDNSVSIIRRVYECICGFKIDLNEEAIFAK